MFTQRARVPNLTSGRLNDGLEMLGLRDLGRVDLTSLGRFTHE